jgi:hypothetical protein
MTKSLLESAIEVAVVTGDFVTFVALDESASQEVDDLDFDFHEHVMESGLFTQNVKFLCLNNMYETPNYEDHLAIFWHMIEFLRSGGYDGDMNCIKDAVRIAADENDIQIIGIMLDAVGVEELNFNFWFSIEDFHSHVQKGNYHVCQLMAHCHPSLTQQDIDRAKDGCESKLAVGKFDDEFAQTSCKELAEFDLTKKVGCDSYLAQLAQRD